MNLANIGFSFGGAEVNESDLEQTAQILDLWSGKITSTFFYNKTLVEVETWADPESDAVGIKVQSDLLSTGLGIFFDFPYSDRNKFDAPFVGVWNATDKHSTTLAHSDDNSATIKHTMDSNSYFTTAKWSRKGAVSGPSPGTHRYLLTTSGINSLELTVSFSPASSPSTPSYGSLISASQTWWRTFWTNSAFIDLTPTQIPSATELLRRTILSLYLLAVNSASSLPPQESGLVNNGWYGKFHLEMTLWHSLPFARWGQFQLLSRSQPATYRAYLPSSRDRAKAQGYAGARWGKMTDPAGRSAPGEINSLLIWQQPHPMYFAETFYRAHPNATTLSDWDEILTATADFMASFAFLNSSTGVYDLGPPLYPVSENTPPNATLNPTFELAYWRFGLDVAIRWKTRQGKPVPPSWLTVRDNLAPLPIQNGTYVTYEGIGGMWTDSTTTNDHPAMSGIFGLLPPPSSGPPLSPSALRDTADKIKSTWALDESYGWDFAMLAMNSLRLGDAAQAVEYLLHPIFAFDDAGYPVGGSRVPTPYFPNSAGFLIAMAMMAGGWDGSEGPHFPEGWAVCVDGFTPAM